MKEADTVGNIMSRLCVNLLTKLYSRLSLYFANASIFFSTFKGISKRNLPILPCNIIP